jgi:protoheme IX farnesyltransferase
MARVTIFLELSKARLCAMVLVTTLVGYLVATPRADLGWALVATLIGTYLAALGANALNQWSEREPDARMQRTRRRPLPSGRLAPRSALAWGVTAAVIGPGLLAATVGPLPAALAAGTVLLYVFLYTPLKRISTLNTFVGAVCGAIPPLIGWSAATGSLATGGWLLFVVLFLWQMPHFLSLAWLYREDYARGGFVMLPVLDPGGRLTFRVTLIFALMLLPVTAIVYLAGVAGPWFAAGASLLAVIWSLACLRLLVRGRRLDARRVFLASLLYLPLALGLMVADRSERPPLRVPKPTTVASTRYPAAPPPTTTGLASAVKEPRRP